MAQRTILFRGKTQSGQWVYGSYVAGIFKDYGHIIGLSTYSDYDNGELSLNEASVVESDTVGQFTGLTDKNGVKIFEGDIVTAFRGNKFEVVFYDKNLSFELSQMQTGVIVPFTTWDYNVEVIGNIHDNPEIK